LAACLLQGLKRCISVSPAAIPLAIELSQLDLGSAGNETIHAARATAIPTLGCPDVSALIIDGRYWGNTGCDLSRDFLPWNAVMQDNGRNAAISRDGFAARPKQVEPTIRQAAPANRRPASAVVKAVNQ
jgi:hypothetical protein